MLNSIDPPFVVIHDVDENGDLLICYVAPNFERLNRHLEKMEQMREWKSYASLV